MDLVVLLHQAEAEVPEAMVKLVQAKVELVVMAVLVARDHLEAVSTITKTTIKKNENKNKRIN